MRGHQYAFKVIYVLSILNYVVDLYVIVINEARRSHFILYSILPSVLLSIMTAVESFVVKKYQFVMLL